MPQLFFKTTTNAYTYNGTTVTAVSDVDYPATTVRGVAYLDGRFFVCTPEGLVYQSADEDGTSWAALEFIGATTEPDAAVFLTKYKDYIMVLKAWSTEFFYDAANATGSILAPVRNMFLKVGCAHDGSVRETTDSVIWMGTTKYGYGRSIYMMQGDQATKVSTPFVDKILDADDLATCNSWIARTGSHELYCISLASISLVLDLSTGIWSVFTYLTASGTTKTVTAISTAGVCTSTAHGYSDGDIIEIASANSSWNGFYVVTDVSTDAFSIQGEGTAFSGSATAEKHTEGAFPIKHSVSTGSEQVMQADGALYKFVQTTGTDDVGAIASRVRTPKFDGGLIRNKVLGPLELIGDKVSSYAVIRWSDDDFASYHKGRPLNLAANRTRVRRVGMTNRRAFEIVHVGTSQVRYEVLELKGVQ